MIWKNITFFWLVIFTNVNYNTYGLQTNKGIFSEKPTAQEFADVFYLVETGYYDPFDVLNEIEALGDDCVKELDKLIFSDNIKPTLPELIGMEGEKVEGQNLQVDVNKEFVLLSLERIRSHASYNVLFDILKKSEEIELRAMALNIINVRYRDFVIKNEVEPDKHFLKYFLDFLDDLTNINAYNISIDKICRNGFIIWMNKDYGDYAEESNLKDDENAPVVKLTKDEKDKWWDENSPKIKWNKEEKKFKISK